MTDHFYAIDESVVKSGKHELPVRRGVPRLRKHGQLVVFTRAIGDILFTGTSSITDVEELDESPEETVGERFVIITFDKVTEWEQSRKLSTVAGSLWRVRRFLDPMRHLARDINVLNERDFDTIKTGKIDVYRSVFRYLFELLPLELRADFVRGYPGGFPASDRGYVTDYVDLAPQLIEFVKNRVEGPLRMMQSIASVHDQLTRANIGVPQLRALLLTGNDSQAPIKFGQIVFDVNQFMQNDSGLFGHRNGVSLLSRCMSALDEAKGRKEKGRKWQDPIF